MKEDIENYPRIVGASLFDLGGNHLSFADRPKRFLGSLKHKNPLQLSSGLISCFKDPKKNEIRAYPRSFLLPQLYQTQNKSFGIFSCVTGSDEIKPAIQKSALTYHWVVNSKDALLLKSLGKKHSDLGKFTQSILRTHLHKTPEFMQFGKFVYGLGVLCFLTRR